MSLYCVVTRNIIFRIYLIFDFYSSIAIERHTLALLIGGEPHHGAATPRASCNRRADGGKAGNTPTATRPTFQITAPATCSSAPTATATPGGQHHDGPRGTFARPSSRGVPFSRRGPRSSTPPKSPQSSSGNSARYFVGLSPCCFRPLLFSSSFFRNLPRY